MPPSEELERSRVSVVDIGLFVSLLCVAIVHRFSTFGPLIYWPDTIGYWTQARQIAEGLPYSTDFHRASRLGVVLPVALFQRLAGTTVMQFYVFAALQSIVQVALVFLLTRLYTGPWLAAFAGALFLGWSLEDFDGSYITADGVAGVWVGLSFYLMTLYAKRGKRGLLAYLSVLSLACAYLTKITSVFFIPGLFLAWSQQNHRWYRDRGAWLFLVVAAGSFIAVERVLLVWVTGATHSVISLTERSYGRSGKLKPLSLIDFLLRPLDLPAEQCFWFVCMIVLSLIFVCRRALRKRIETSLLVGASIFIVAVLYSPKALFPLTPAALIRPRYYSAALPIMSVAFVVGGHTLLRYLAVYTSHARWVRFLTIGALSSLGMLSLARVPQGIDTVAKVMENSSNVTEAYQAGDTIFARHDRAGKYLLNAARWLLIPGPGKPPPIREQGTSYFVKSSRALASDSGGCLRMKGSLKERTHRNKNKQLVTVVELPSSADTFLSTERVAQESCP